MKGVYPQSENLKTLTTGYLKEAKNIADSLSTTRNIKKLAKIITTIYDAWVSGHKVFLCGNGGSASTANHFTSDLLNLGVPAYCLNDNVPRLTATTNDRGFEYIFREQIARLGQENDVLIAISVHGGGVKRNYKEGDEWWSNNLLEAVDYAKALGMKTIALVGFEGGILNKICDASLKINVYSTPQVESWHCHIAHLVCEVLDGYKPIKRCLNCYRVYKITTSLCPSCGGAKYALAGGIIGNIEDIRRIYDNSEVTS